MKKKSQVKVRCGYTTCKNNFRVEDGYFCNQKTIHLYSYFSSAEREKGTQMKCEQYGEVK